MQEQKGQNIGKRMFYLITGLYVFGDCETVITSNGSEILVKTPYTPLNGGIAAYCMSELAGSPAAIQLHPMNIVWQCPLDEFEQVNKAYITATSGIITDTKAKIIL